MTLDKDGDLTSDNPIVVGVDTGGTFTDFIIVADGRLIAHKVLSTPDAPERAILQGLSELGLMNNAMDLRHGTTVATNAVLEGKGARVAFVTNRGFEDLLTLARQNRRELYRLSCPPEPSPVPHDLCFGADCRTDAQGTVIRELHTEELDTLVASIVESNPDAVAVSLLFSFLDARHEDAIATALRAAGVRFVSISSHVLAEIGEYERSLTTWLNAYVAPKIEAYLGALRHALGDRPLSVMQSDGLLIDGEQAPKNGARLLLSGPAGGLEGARVMAAACGFRQLMTIDVGGTSTDVALIDETPSITRDGHLGPYPVAVPMVDMHTVGAGGGSIARVDAQGLLHVGPQSAGAAPGPACYGRGGQEPTVTDAMVVLGRIPAQAKLGSGELEVDSQRARAALSALANDLNVDVEKAALGVLAIANQHMAQALRVISVERGRDPRDFVLCAFGGAGGLHACELAEELGCRTVLIPAHAGVLSALGIALAGKGRESTRAILCLLDDTFHGHACDEIFDAMSRESGGEEQAILEYKADLRYRGQSDSITVPWADRETMLRTFHDAHEQQNGHALDLPVELVNLRLRVSNPPTSLPLEGAGLWTTDIMHGPRTLAGATGATYIPAGWSGVTDSLGNLRLAKYGEN